MNWLDWYNSLAKPNWTPAPATIGMIWQILYPIILVSFGFVGCGLSSPPVYAAIFAIVSQYWA